MLDLCLIASIIQLIQYEILEKLVTCMYSCLFLYIFLYCFHSPPPFILSLWCVCLSACMLLFYVSVRIFKSLSASICLCCHFTLNLYFFFWLIFFFFEGLKCIKYHFLSSLVCLAEPLVVQG